MRLLTYWSRLERVHRGYAQAATEIETAIGGPICVAKCGLCCHHNSVVAYGIEAELAASWLLGQPRLINPVLDRCHDWLTRRDNRYTYGSKITPELWSDLRGEFEQALQEPCVLLDQETKQCLVHWGRPLVCRAYGVTRVPAPHCPRPLGPAEDIGSRTYWDGRDRSLNLYRDVDKLLKSIIERRYDRQGFFVTMLYERFRAKELAGLLDDGKVPLVKAAVGWGTGYLLLWQEQLERQWRAEAADNSIAEQVPLEDRDGLPVMVMRVGRRRK